MFLLPVSQVAVAPRAPDGHDELLLAEGARESAVDSIAWRLAVVRRLAPPLDAGTDWDDLPFVDMDAALLAIRRHLHGDRLCAELRCASCDGWGDVTLSIDAYLAGKRPERVRGLNRSEDGWLGWKGMLLRIPSAGAVLRALEQEPAPDGAAEQLLQECVSPRSGMAPARASSRVGALLERIAPRLAGLLQGSCPHCGQLARGWFDPGQFVLRELQMRADAVFEQIHLIASRYGWSEATILALPARRRALFAGFIEQERRA